MPQLFTLHKAAHAVFPMPTAVSDVTIKLL